MKLFQAPVDWGRIEGPAYWLVFVAAFFAVAVWESTRPKAVLRIRAERRWGVHGILLVMSAIFMGLMLRVAPVYFAVFAVGHGLLDWLRLPFAARFLLGILGLDLSHYLGHRLFHSVGVLWRIHRVHHSDPDFDVSTGARFHPLEVLMVQGGTLAVIWVLAPPPSAVLTAVLLTAAENLFAHANCSLPGRVESILKWFIITPDLHRLHHSSDERDYNRNFGQMLPWWDRIFGTISERPAGRAPVTGVSGVRHDQAMELGYLLTGPFRRQ